MGCDIHLYYEIKKNGEWIFLDWEKEFIEGNYEDGYPKYNYDKLFEHPLYVGRNYDLFGILANVRNGRGFAACVTGEGFIPIDLPREIPKDVTNHVKTESESWGIDGHSHSWLSLKELLEYDWDQTTTQYSYTNKESYLQFKEKGKPFWSIGGVSGGRVKYISNAEMEIVIEKDLDDYDYYTQISWQETYREAVGECWFKTLDYLNKLDNPKNIRLVFWFDN